MASAPTVLAHLPPDDPDAILQQIEMQENSAPSWGAHNIAPGIVQEGSKSTFTLVNSLSYVGALMYRENPGLPASLEAPNCFETCQLCCCFCCVSPKPTEEIWRRGAGTKLGFDRVQSQYSGLPCGALVPTIKLNDEVIGHVDYKDQGANICSDAEKPVVQLMLRGEPRFEIRVWKEALCPCSSGYWCSRNCSFAACVSCGVCFDLAFTCGEAKCLCPCCDAFQDCCRCTWCPCCSCFSCDCCTCGGTCGCPYSCFNCKCGCLDFSACSPKFCCQTCSLQCNYCCNSCCEPEPEVKKWTIVSQPVFAIGEQGEKVGSIDSLWYQKMEDIATHIKQSMSVNVPRSTPEEEALLLLLPWEMRDKKRMDIPFMQTYSDEQLQVTLERLTFDGALTQMGLN